MVIIINPYFNKNQVNTNIELLAVLMQIVGVYKIIENYNGGVKNTIINLFYKWWNERPFFNDNISKKESSDGLRSSLIIRPNVSEKNIRNEFFSLEEKVNYLEVKLRNISNELQDYKKENKKEMVKFNKNLHSLKNNISDNKQIINNLYVENEKENEIEIKYTLLVLIGMFINMVLIII